MEQKHLLKLFPISFPFRWSELTRKLSFNVEVQELSETGEYIPVEVQPRTDIGTGGIFQLRQGQQRRIMVTVQPAKNSGTLPIIAESVLNIAVGSPCVRSKLQKPLDSYQEEDLNQLRQRWIEALGRRREVGYSEGKNLHFVNMKDNSFFMTTFPVFGRSNSEVHSQAGQDGGGV